MRIKRLHIRGFGRLEAVSLDFDERFTLLYGPNESGKSTVFECILAMLYGFPSGRIKSVLENSRIHYMPWNRRVEFGGMLTLVHNGVEYEIDRSFGESKSQDRTKVVRTVSGDEIPLGKKEPGEELLKMTRSEFLNTVYITQTDTSVSSDREIEKKLMQTVSGTAGEGSAREMEQALFAYRKELDSERSRRPTARSAAVEKKEALDRLLEEANEKENLRISLTEGLRRTEQRIAALEAEHSRMQRRLSVRASAAKLEADQRLLERWNTLDDLEQRLETGSEERGPLPDAALIAIWKEALRNWEIRSLQLESIRASLPQDTQESLRLAMEEIRLQTEELAAMEAEWTRLSGIRQELIAEQAEEKRNWEEQQKTRQRHKEEKRRLDDEILGRKQRLEAERNTLQEVRRKYEGQAPKIVNIPLLAGGVLLIAAGVILSLQQRQPLWLGLALIGTLLVLAGIRRKTAQTSDASQALIHKMESDLNEMVTEVNRLHAEREDLPEPEEDRAFVRSEGLRTRYGTYREEMILWQQELQAAGMEEIGEILTQKKDLASRQGGLQERQSRLQEWHAQLKHAVTENRTAAEEFLTLSAAHFTAEDPKVARTLLDAFEKALSEQQEWEKEIARLRERIREDRGERTREAVRESAAVLAIELQGNEIPSAEEAERLARELNRIKEAQQEARDTKIALQLKLSDTKKDPLIPSVVEYEVEQAEEAILRIDKEVEAVDMALLVLDESLRELQESFGPELNRVTAEHLAGMTQEESLSVSVDRDFSVKITDPRTQTRHAQGYFSAGKIDQIYLALRMAISEVVYRKSGSDPLPLLLDDALDQYDNERALRTLDKLMKSAVEHGHQVVFASCHERIRDYADARGAAMIRMRR